MKEKLKNEKERKIKQKSHIALHTSQNKGITLVALIITIVVLLILAVVAIRAVQGDGIIGHAKNAQTGYENAQANELGILSGYEMELAKNSPTSLSDEIIGTKFEKTTFVKDGNGKIFVVPAGYTIVKEGENTVEVDKGVVIKDDSNNQFVWVPVTATIQAYGIGTTDYREPDVVLKEYNSSWILIDGGDNNLNNLEIINAILGTSYENANDFLKDMQADFNNMASSVNRYNGFYVGRYEMSLNETTGNAQSVQGAPSATAAETSANTWYGLYAKAKTYTNPEKTVVSSMIWGSQYDAMMSWMGAVADTDIGDNRNKKRTTGTCEKDVINNVYDLYGNSFEWTQEANNASFRVFRGGYCDDASSPGSRLYSDPAYPDWSPGGSRLALYIK